MPGWAIIIIVTVVIILVGCPAIAIYEHYERKNKLLAKTGTGEKNKSK